MRNLALALALTAIAAPAFAGTGVFKPQLTFNSSNLTARVYKPCTPGSLGYTYFYGAYGEPEKKDNCTGQITSNY